LTNSSGTAKVNGVRLKLIVKFWR